jgi:multidrug efflux pump subunit AcrB
MSTRFQIAALMFMMTNAVAFGVGLVPILMIPTLANHAFEAIPAVVLASVVISAPLSWLIAPRLRARYWRSQNQDTTSRSR